ncbi:MAG: IS607 family transposase, partial [Chlamydiae bacterium]|nr:IS607 family transposase [Chlamydiota bacterium]
QAELLALYCTKQGWTFEVIQDLGSGMNYRKKGLQKLLDLIMKKQIKRLALTHKDRLLRFGAELIFTLCEVHHVEVVIINQGSEPSFEKELVQDVLEIITVFSARMYGARSKKNRKLVETVQELL